jgi:hypothetical protein
MKTIKKAQTGVKQKPATEKPKIAPKKPKTVSQRIGDTTLRDIKNASEDGLQLATLGVYGKVKKALGGEYKYKKIGEKKYGGKVTKAKNGKSFPDLNKDGKITKADILKGRGVIAKRGATIKKAQTGRKLTPNYSNIKAGGFDSFKTPTAKDSADYRAGFDTKIKNKELKQSDRPSGAKIRGYNEAYKRTKKAKAGASVKKCRYGCK